MTLPTCAPLPTHPPVQSPLFTWSNLLVIIANTAVMASVSYPMADSWNAIDDSINLAFTCWFAAEMVVKLVGLGWRGYFKAGMNRYVDGQGLASWC